MQNELPQNVCLNAMLPLFKEQAHSPAMIRHSMIVVRDAVKFLNPGQFPVVTFDQPLYAIAKQVQWNWPDMFGEDQFVVMLGGLHIEMASFKALGNWLDGSGWTDVLVQAEVAKSGTADSFLKASHITRTRHAHQATAATLFILQKQAYDAYVEATATPPLEFDAWCLQQQHAIPQFKYWSLTLEF